MANVKITTNNIPREMMTFNELPSHVREDFDYVKDYDTRQFVFYRGSYYDVHDTQGITTIRGGKMGWDMVVENDSPLAKWRGIISETYFSGIVFRVTPDGGVVVGSYSS